jgi:predicted ABC-type ATPase
MKTARDAGYTITLVYVTLEAAKLNVERVIQRVKRGGHGIDPVVIRRRVEESRANFPAALLLSHRTLVVDNSKDQHRKLLEMKHGRIEFQAADLPGWLAGYLPS